MRLTELLRDVADNLEISDPDMVASVLRTAADTIESNNIYKVKWAELGEQYATLEKHYETVLAELKTLRNEQDEL